MLFAGHGGIIVLGKHRAAADIEHPQKRQLILWLRQSDSSASMRISRRKFWNKFTLSLAMIETL